MKYVSDGPVGTEKFESLRNSIADAGLTAVPTHEGDGTITVECKSARSAGTVCKIARGLGITLSSAVAQKVEAAPFAATASTVSCGTKRKRLEKQARDPRRKKVAKVTPDQPAQPPPPVISYTLVNFGTKTKLKSLVDFFMTSLRGIKGLEEHTAFFRQHGINLEFDARRVRNAAGETFLYGEIDGQWQKLDPPPHEPPFVAWEKVNQNTPLKVVIFLGSGDAIEPKALVKITHECFVHAFLYGALVDHIRSRPDAQRPDLSLYSLYNSHDDKFLSGWHQHYTHGQGQAPFFDAAVRHINNSIPRSPTVARALNAFGQGFSYLALEDVRKHKSGFPAPTMAKAEEMGTSVAMRLATQEEQEFDSDAELHPMDLWQALTQWIALGYCRDGVPDAVEDESEMGRITKELLDNVDGDNLTAMTDYAMAREERAQSVGDSTAWANCRKFLALTANAKLA